MIFKGGQSGYTNFSPIIKVLFGEEKAGIKSAIGLFTNHNSGHAMVPVHLDNLGFYPYHAFTDLKGYCLTSGKWIIIEPQCTSLTEQDTKLNNWITQWNIVASEEVPNGP